MILIKPYEKPWEAVLSQYYPWDWDGHGRDSQTRALWPTCGMGWDGSWSFDSTNMAT